MSRADEERELNEAWTRVFGGDSAHAAAFRDVFREAVNKVVDRDETRKRGKSARDTQRETPESLARDDPA